MSNVEVVALLVGAVACAIDIRTRRIPNTLTFPAIVLGIAAHAWSNGASGFTQALLGAGTGLAVFFPIFVLGGLGGGDVKLMAALGAWVGWHTVVWAGLYGAVAGGVLALALSLSQGYLGQALTNIGGLFLYWSAEGLKPMPALTLAHGRGARLPYAGPIFLGLLAALWGR